MSQDSSRKKEAANRSSNLLVNAARQFAQELRQLGQKAVAFLDLALYLPEPRGNEANRSSLVRRNQALVSYQTSE
jgi:hypothetical protein